MDFSNFTFRCSSLGHIMQDPKGKSNRELFEEYNLEYTQVMDRLSNPGKSQTKTLDKLFDRGEWLSQEIDRLEPIQDVPHLSDSCKTHLCDIYTVVKYGRTSDIKSKYLEKGLLLEEDAITLYCELTGKYHRKNKDRKYNDWVEGECDIDSEVLDLVTDTKVNWDIFTFNRVVGKPIKPLYHWQLDGYMWLWGRSKGELAYCLLDTPEHLIQREEKKLMYEMFGSEFVYQNSPEEQKLNYELNEVKAKYKNLSDKVRKMLELQQSYFKSKKDWQIFKAAKAMEGEVDAIVNPKPVSQAQMDFLAR